MQYHSLVSIILPVFNQGTYLPISIDSVIKQNWTNWELIIINDGSNDESEKIILNYKDPRIIYIYQENQGVSKARNAGLKVMNGDFFCFLDADDLLPPGSLENRLKVFKGTPENMYVDGKVKVFDEFLKTKISTWEPSYRGLPFNELVSLSGKCFFGPTWMIRRDKNKQYHFNEHISHGEDLLFYIEQAIENGRYDYCEDCILHYRKGNKSAMKNLMGLENGYLSIYKILKGIDRTTTQQLEYFRKKVKRIMFKSYLSNYQPVNAVRSLFKKWEPV
jgi:glycosyltransferase involved in cell wall biosynthesis